MRVLALIAASAAASIAVAAAAETAADVAPPAAIALRAVGHGWVLTDARGMTLYSYAQDQKGGPPACVAKCIETWRPLAAPVGAAAADGASAPAAAGDWSSVARDDGSRQWTFRGKPLYTFVRDATPGDMNGDDLQQKWAVAVKPIAMPPGFGIFKTPLGHLLVDAKRMTLYTSADSRSLPSKCEGTCARTWKPVEAWWLAVAPSPDWTLVARGDGTKQWAFRGRPLYRYAADFNPGEATGQDVEGRTAVVLEPAPPNPAWSTRRKSDGGELLADAAGKTLYGHDPSGYHLGREIEHPEWWVPVLAAADARPLGAWSIVPLENGRRQWAYKGLRLYTNVLDREPGDINGVRSGDRIWRPIMTSGQTMSGSGL